jgi:hypothetical protein
LRHKDSQEREERANLAPSLPFFPQKSWIFLAKPCKILPLSLSPEWLRRGRAGRKLDRLKKKME